MVTWAPCSHLNTSTNKKCLSSHLFPVVSVVSPLSNTSGGPSLLPGGTKKGTNDMCCNNSRFFETYQTVFCHCDSLWLWKEQLSILICISAQRIVLYHTTKLSGWFQTHHLHCLTIYSIWRNDRFSHSATVLTQIQKQVSCCFRKNNFHLFLFYSKNKNMGHRISCGVNINTILKKKRKHTRENMNLGQIHKVDYWCTLMY